MIPAYGSGWWLDPHDWLRFRIPYRVSSFERRRTFRSAHLSPVRYRIRRQIMAELFQQVYGGA